AHREVERFDVAGADRETVDMGDGHAVSTEGDFEDGVTACIDEPEAGFIPRSGVERAVCPGDPAVDEVVRIHNITGITAQNGVRGAVGHHAPLTTHSHPAMVTHIHVPVAAHVHPRQHAQLVLGGAAVDTVDPVI